MTDHDAGAAGPVFDPAATDPAVPTPATIDATAVDTAVDAAVSDLFTALVQDYRPSVDLTAAALAGARQAKRRARLAWTAGGGLATAAVAAVIAVSAVEVDTGPTSTPAVTVGGGTATTHIGGALNPACVGKWLPWTDQSDASLFGKGTDAQRAVVCTNDMEMLKTVVPGVTVAPYFETFAEGQNTDFTPDQIAKMGSGLAPDTHILKPWQYDATLSGKTAYFFISYSTNRSDVGTGCVPVTPQPLSGPRPGYQLVCATSESGMTEVLVETPDHAYFGIGVSPLTGGPFTPPFDPAKLVKDSRFIAALDADLQTLYGG